MENRCEPQTETSLNATSCLTQTEEATAANPEPRPWLRFWARMIDVNFFSILLTYLAIMALRTMILARLVRDLPTAIVIGLLLVISGTLIFETICLAIWGTTPGKWVANIRVEQENGEEPTLRQSFHRTILVFFRGLGLWIPIISFFTIMAGYNRVINKGIASWDEDCKTIFVQGPMSAFRTAILVGLGLLMLYGTNSIFDYLPV